MSVSPEMGLFNERLRKAESFSFRWLVGSVTTTDARLHPIAGTVTHNSTSSVGYGGLYHVKVGYGDPRILLCEKMRGSFIRHLNSGRSDCDSSRRKCNAIATIPCKIEKADDQGCLSLT